tara:strand:- start:624 stop:1847 length:1224 start_codon:yes stop_codon:yes gene_type:complete
MNESLSSKIVTSSVFFFTIAIVGISIISVIFPALIISNTYEFPHQLEPFETSPWLIPIIISILTLLGIRYLFIKDKLPSIFNSTIKFIFNFEISKKISIIIGIIILGFYIGFSLHELSLNEAEQWGDYLILEEALRIWPSTEHMDVYIKEQNTRYVRMALLDFSQEYFQNIKIIPFSASILVVIFTALVTIQLSKKRFAGILAMIVLLQSPTFTDFDTVAVYENIWVLFFLISIYSIHKKWWYSSPALFITSVFSKAFVATYFWMNIFFIYRSEIPKKIKFSLFVAYAIIVGIIYAIFESEKSIIYDDIVRINSNAFFDAFTGWGNAMQLDPLMILCIVPLSVGLLFKSINGVKQADSILIMIAGTILAGPLISLITDFYFILPYRFIPFIIFVAIGIGVLFTKNKN